MHVQRLVLLGVATLIQSLFGAAVVSDGVHLVVGSESIAPLYAWKGSPPTMATSEVFLTVTDHALTGRDRNTGAISWQANHPGLGTLTSCGVVGDVWYAAENPACPQTTSPLAFPLPVVLRLDTSTGKWLSPLHLLAEKGVELLPHTAIAIGQAVAIASDCWIKNKRDWQHDGISVSVFDGETLRWTQRFPPGESRSEPGAYLLSRRQPAAAQNGLKTLVAYGDDLLVCSGPKTPIRCLAATDGSEQWSVDSLWEFDRNFIGPSMWTHEMRRFGRDVDEEAWKRAGTETVNVTEADRIAVDAQRPGVLADWRKQFNETKEAWLMGGPWLVPRSDPNRLPAILVATAIAPRHQFAANLARCRIYDVSESGTPVALVDLPRLIAPQHTVLSAGSLVMAGDPSGQMAIYPNNSAQIMFGMGMGSEDCLLQVAWYNDPPPAAAEVAWISSDPSESCAAFTEERIIVQNGGGSVVAQGDVDMHFSLLVVDPKNGSRNAWSLTIPFDEAVPLPRTNYRGSDTSRHALGWYQATISNLVQYDDLLVITIASGRHGEVMHTFVFRPLMHP